MLVVVSFLLIFPMLLLPVLNMTTLAYLIMLLMLLLLLVRGSWFVGIVFIY